MKGISFMLNFGRYGGFYVYRDKGFSFRVCLGWVAWTVFFCDIDLALSKILGIEVTTSGKEE